MLFCPWDGTLLEVHQGAMVQFLCPVCPYKHGIDPEDEYRVAIPTQKKEVDDIMGGEEAWENKDKTEHRCPNPDCDSEVAYFMQIQLRSADEPMSTFYRCVKCHEMDTER